LEAEYLFALIALLLSFFLVIFKAVLPNEFLEFGKWIVGLFIAGNATMDVAGIIKGE
jgi:hypothetical protein